MDFAKRKFLGLTAVLLTVLLVCTGAVAGTDELWFRTRVCEGFTRGCDSGR